MPNENSHYSCPNPLFHNRCHFLSIKASATLPVQLAAEHPQKPPVFTPTLDCGDGEADSFICIALIITMMGTLCRD